MVSLLICGKRVRSSTDEAAETMRCDLRKAFVPLGSAALLVLQWHESVRDRQILISTKSTFRRLEHLQRPPPDPPHSDQVGTLPRAWICEGIVQNSSVFASRLYGRAVRFFDFVRDLRIRQNPSVRAIGDPLEAYIRLSVQP